MTLFALGSCRTDSSNPVVPKSEPPSPEQFVQDILDQTSLDSLEYSVNQLSGAASITVNGVTNTITSRFPTYNGHALAIAYLTQRLASYGLNPAVDSFTSQAIPQYNHGANVTARKPGTDQPNYLCILCAHYDAEPSVPGADDNASGTAVVLEAARILSRYQTRYTIVFAFWDEEELGIYGSEYFATKIPASNDSVVGVINMDMLGYDSNDDGKMDIHTIDVGRSTSLADTLVYIIRKYQLALSPIVYNPGTYDSDHASFWTHQYSAVVFSEAYYGGDFNPHYHTVQDKIDYFNPKFFLNCSKLGIATISLLASASPR